ncbi:MAG TPA: hypothetical protein DEB35_09320, partial [Desulfuromonas sp.]|nr:hypothetical protein [Desulfuromonas sp.]
DALVTFTADPTYQISRIVVDGVELPGAPFASPYDYTFSNVTKAHSLYAIFEATAPTYLINPYKYGGGTVTAPTSVAKGSNHTVTFTANPGYQISRIVVDGVDLPGAPFASPYDYTFTNVTRAHSLYAVFVK